MFNIYVAAAKMLLTGDGILKARDIVPDATRNERPAVQFLKLVAPEEKEKQVEDKDDEEDNEEGVDGDINAKLAPAYADSAEANTSSYED